MTPERIAQSYDKIATHWAGPTFNRLNGIKQHERAISFATPGPALDVGCGSSGRFIDLLLKNSFQPEGLDVSTKMLELAKQNIQILCFIMLTFAHWEHKVVLFHSYLHGIVCGMCSLLSRMI